MKAPGGERGGKVALVTGISGQDGVCLAQLLISKGYRVVGTTRGIDTDLWRIEESGLRDDRRLDVRKLDLDDAEGCAEIVADVMPAEVYNLGGLSFIGQSFTEPVRTARTTGLGAINLLDAIRTARPETRFFQASSSEMFGNTNATPQDEQTSFHPRSPYAVAKLFAHWATVNYRECFDIFGVSGILYNHESPLRGIDFVTRKITDGVARIHLGIKDALDLGNLNSSRDWGYAPEYAEAMWRSLQIECAESFVLASGRLTAVRTFVEAAFRAAGAQIVWQGSGLDEVGCDSRSGIQRVRVSPAFFRPVEKVPLCGKPAKAQRLLGWKAETQIEEICRIMVEKDIDRLRSGRLS